MITPRQIINFLSFYLIVLFSFQVQAAKTICAMTINSSDEIQSFKNNLNPEEFKFIELTQYTDNPQKSWLRNACEAGVTCDALVISGHFAGTFFGSSGKSLSLKEIEKASCSSSCDGILKKPKEVYLFGCNTLAGKEKDSRTPEQYLQVLLTDGFSLGQAQQVVAFRYSPIGSSFSNRMRSVFTYTPRIYGFNSISPLGKNVAPVLNKFFTKNAYSYSEKLFSSSSAPNKELLSYFKHTSMVQASGMSLTLDPQNQLELSPVCFLSSTNKKNSRQEKLKWIEQLLAKGNGLEMLMYVSDFFHQEKQSGRWTKEEKQIFKNIQENSSLKTELFNLLKSEAKWLERSKLDILAFIKEVNWLDEDTANERIYSILKLKESTFNVDDMRRVCGYGFQYPVNIYDFNANNWGNDYFKYALMCITPEDSYSIWNKIYELNYGN